MLVFAILGTLFLWSGHVTAALATKKAVIATHDIPAFTVVTENDVVTTDRAGQDVPQDAIRDKDDIIGRYTLEEIPGDGPVVARMLGPAARVRALDLPFAMALAGGPEVALDGRLSPGDSVDILLTSAPRSPPVPRIHRAVVLDGPSVVEGNRWTVLVGLSDELSDEQAGAIAGGKFALVRRS